MEILGNSYQEKEPLPTEPVEIKNSLIIITKDGKRIEIPNDKNLERVVGIDGKWHIKREGTKAWKKKNIKKY